MLPVGSLAQLVEQRTFNPLVAGSSPARPTTNLQYQIKALQVIATPFFVSAAVRSSTCCAVLVASSNPSTTAAPLRPSPSHGWSHAALKEMVSLFAVPSVQYEVRLLLAPPVPQALNLGNQRPDRKRLGLNSFLNVSVGKASRADIRSVLRLTERRTRQDNGIAPYRRRQFRGSSIRLRSSRAHRMLCTAGAIWLRRWNLALQL